MTPKPGDFHVKDPALADRGQDRIEWAEQNMPVLRSIRERFEAEQPLKGLAIGACLQSAFGEHIPSGNDSGDVRGRRCLQRERHMHI